MSYLYRTNIIFDIFLLLMISVFSQPSLATSKGYSAPAQVILKDNTPCFFADMGTQKPTLAGQTITVFDNRYAITPEWRIDEREGIAPLPSSMALCVKYGTSWPTGITKMMPAQLQYDVPYFADIATGIRNGARFRVNFCLSEDSHGRLLLTKWADDGKHCTKTPLNDSDKPSIWERIFGNE